VLEQVARENKFVVFAEPDILLMSVPRYVSGINPKDYVSALCQVHGWTYSQSNTSNVFIIKAPDIAKVAVIPKSAFSQETEQEFRSLGYDTYEFNNRLYTRIPDALNLPKIKQPKPLKFTLRITQFNKTKLDELGLSVDVLAGIQNENASILGSFTLFDLVSGATPVAPSSAQYFNLLSSVRLSKLKSSIHNTWTVSMFGNDVSTTGWNEEQTQNVLIENANVDDARVSVDREEITAGRSLLVDPIGNDTFRINLTDTSVNPDTLGVTGLSYQGDVSLKGGHITWIQTARTVEKAKGLFNKGYEQVDLRYVITLQVQQHIAPKPLRTVHAIPKALVVELPKKKKKSFLTKVKNVFRRKKSP